MTQPTVAPLFELTIEVYSHETWHDFGTFATRELAEQARDVLLANWSDECEAPSLSQTHIREVAVLDAVPPYHLYQAWQLLEGGEVTVQRLRRPQLQEFAPPWHLLEDKARFARVAPEHVSTTGRTAEDALARCKALHAEALTRGALDFLTRSRALAARSMELAAEQAAAQGIQVESFRFSQLQSELFDQLAEEAFGPSVATN